MRKGQHTEEQIIGVPKEAEAGKPVNDLCREHGITDQTYYRWKSKYGGLEVSEARRQAAGGREPPTEASGGGPDAGQPGAQRAAQPKVTKPTARREAVGWVRQEFRSEPAAGVCGGRGVALDDALLE
jgi:transposase-like protein